VAAKLPIVEDNPYGDLWFDTPPPAPLATRWSEGTVYLGSFSKIMKLLPDQLLGGIGMPQLDEEQSAEMERQLKRTEAIIDSMTREERGDHRVLNASRRRRVARGSGTTVTEVNQLVKQYVEMRQMMQQLSRSGIFGGGGGGGIKGRLMRRAAGMMGMPDVSGMAGDGGDAGLPAAPGHRKKKKPRHKKRR